MDESDSSSSESEAEENTTTEGADGGAAAAVKTNKKRVPKAEKCRDKTFVPSFYASLEAPTSYYDDDGIMC